MNLSPEEILRKVTQKEHEKRCVKARVCPSDGDDLAVVGDEAFLDLQCPTCKKKWVLV